MMCPASRLTRLSRNWRAGSGLASARKRPRVCLSSDVSTYDETLALHPYLKDAQHLRPCGCEPLLVPHPLANATASRQPRRRPLCLEGRIRASSRFLLLLTGLTAMACIPEKAPVKQPFAFNHAIHLKKEIPCTDCHSGAETKPRAGLPALSQCLLCHMKPQQDPPSEREQQVRKMAADGVKLKWIQVNQNPGPVYFSHRMHVTVAKMQCEQCHPGVKEWTAPPERMNPKLNDMDACMDCHRKNNASNQCRVCHR